MNHLTDAYLDQALDKSMFEERKKGLLLDQKAIEENIANLNRKENQHPKRLEIFLELAGSAWLSYQLALPEEKREMINIVTSNRLVMQKSVDLQPSLAFQAIANRYENFGCAPQRAIPRTWDQILEELAALNTRGELPDLSVISGFLHRGDATNPVCDGRDDSISLSE